LPGVAGQNLNPNESTMEPAENRHPDDGTETGAQVGNPLCRKVIDGNSKEMFGGKLRLS
jgi:hypothetical protein